MKSIILSICFSCVISLSFSQDLDGEYFVISTTGLNFREAPKADSNILLTIPFGTKVKVTGKKSFRIDTIGSYGFNNSESNESSKINIIGNWLKVTYKEKTGYLFDAYLLRSFKNWQAIPNNNKLNLNKKFVLLFPGTWCDFNFWYNPKFKWYGCYREGNQYKLKELDIYFLTNWGDYITDMGISTSHNKDLLFVVGSKTQFSEGEISGKYNPNWWTNNFDEHENIEIKKSKNYNKVVLSSSGREQLLNSHLKNKYSPSSILWEGDLDKDGKLDYIINYGEKSCRTFLYLSNEANKNQIVKPVSVFFSGYCC